jgi:hypothetical protein
MAKGQSRSNREVKKPKQTKTKKVAVTLPLAAPESGAAKGQKTRETQRR